MSELRAIGPEGFFFFFPFSRTPDPRIRTVAATTTRVIPNTRVWFCCDGGGMKVTMMVA